MSLAVVMLSVLLAVALLLCGFLALRLAQLRRAGTPVLLRTVPAGVDQGWRHGTVHYSDDSLRYYRLTSLKPGPNVTFARQGMEISGRRAPEGTETDILDGMLILQVQTAGRAEDAVAGLFDAVASGFRATPG